MKTETINSLRKIFDNRDSLGLKISKAASAYKIDPSMLEFEEGFNPRDYSTPDVEAHIQTLYQAIVDGQDPGLFKVAVKDGRIFTRDGHCRTIAIKRAIKAGVKVKPVLAEETDQELEEKCPSLTILTSNNGLKLKPLERAAIYVRILESGYSASFIAKIEGITEVAVNNLVRAYSLPDDVKEFINDSTISVTTALDLAKEYKKNTGNVIRQKLAEKTEGFVPVVVAESREEQISIFNQIEKSHNEQNSGDMSPKKGEEWDLLSSFAQPEQQAASQDEKNDDTASTKNKTPGKSEKAKAKPLAKPKLSISDFGAKVIKGDQSKRVIEILSKLVSKIENVSPEEHDAGSIDISIDQELAEAILVMHKKLKG